MTTHTISNQDKVLKEYYTDDKIKEQSYGENPMFAFIKKERGVMAGGRRYVQPIEFAHPGGGAADYAKAMSNGTVSQYDDFLIPRKKQYQRVEVAHELLFATTNQRESFRKALDEFDRGLKGLGEKIGRRLYRTQGGAIGQMANTTVNTTVIQLADFASVFNFHIGDTLTFSLTDGTGSELDSGDTTRSRRSITRTVRSRRGQPPDQDHRHRDHGLRLPGRRLQPVPRGSRGLAAGRQPRRRSSPRRSTP
jgi:hypothetical protein